MRRVVVLGLFAIAVVFVASIASILWVTGDAPEVAATVPGVPSMASNGSPNPARQVPAGNGVAAQPGPQPAPRHPDGTIGDGISTAKELYFRSFRRALNIGVADLQNKVEPCSLVDASLTLTLETVRGGIRVADARVDRRGSATDEAVACAVSAVRGYVMRADSAEPGRTWEVPFVGRSRG